MKSDSDWVTYLFMGLICILIFVIFISVTLISQRNIPITENVYPIQSVTCVQSEYWICDIRIDDEVILGHRSPIELHTGDPLVVFVKDNRKYIFNL